MVLRPAWSEAFRPEVLLPISVPGNGITSEWAFEEASGAELGPPWSLWFEERATTVADIDAVLDSFASASR